MIRYCVAKLGNVIVGKKMNQEKSEFLKKVESIYNKGRDGKQLLTFGKIDGVEYVGFMDKFCDGDDIVFRASVMPWKYYDTERRFHGYFGLFTRTYKEPFSIWMDIYINESQTGVEGWNCCKGYTYHDWWRGNKFFPCDVNSKGLLHSPFPGQNVSRIVIQLIQMEKLEE